MTACAPVISDRLRALLADVPAVPDRIGRDPANGQVREVGDRNVKLVFLVESPACAPAIRRGLPCIRLVGDSSPSPPERAVFESGALVRQAARAPGRAVGIGFCGVEMYRRILRRGHVEDLECLADAAHRVVADRRALAFGRHLAVNRATMSMDGPIRTAERIEREDLA